MIKLEEYIKKPLKERQAHLNLNEECIERGTNSTMCRGLLAYYLDTTANASCKPWVDLCHACNNPDCSNPKHLYWGTRSENMHDLVNSGYKPIGAKGYKNGNYKLPPWENVACNYNIDVRNSWLKAKEIYENYVLKNWDFSKYGHGYQYFMKNYNLVQGTSRTMIILFKKNWNPLKDESYINFYNEYSKLKMDV